MTVKTQPRPHALHPAPSIRPVPSGRPGIRARSARQAGTADQDHTPREQRRARLTPACHMPLRPHRVQAFHISDACFDSFTAELKMVFDLNGPARNPDAGLIPAPGAESVPDCISGRVPGCVPSESGPDAASLRARLESRLVDGFRGLLFGPGHGRDRWLDGYRASHPRILTDGWDTVEKVVRDQESRRRHALKRCATGTEIDAVPHLFDAITAIRDADDRRLIWVVLAQKATGRRQVDWHRVTAACGFTARSREASRVRYRRLLDMLAAA